MGLFRAKAMKVLYPKLVRAVVSHFRLPLRSPHGPAHWMRVRNNGLLLAELTGANTRVVELFALFHDSCRKNEHIDPSHGPRAAAFVEACHKSGLLKCSDEELEMLLMACYGHTSERYSDDTTIATCWDADRLDLPRVGIMPIPRRLCTDAARSHGVIQAAMERAEAWVTRKQSQYF